MTWRVLADTVLAGGQLAVRTAKASPRQKDHPFTLPC